MNHKMAMEIDPLLFLWLAAAVILLPIQWVAAWLVAVCVHELCHYFAIRMCGRRVFSMRVSLTGAVMESEPLPYGKEAFCALAGPIGGLTLLIFARWFPRTAICDFVHAAFNLLPIFPMDGGRVLRCVIGMIAPEVYRTRIEMLIAWLTRGAILLCGFYIALVLRLGALPMVATVGLIIKSIKIPCKQSIQRVQ